MEIQNIKIYPHPALREKNTDFSPEEIKSEITKSTVKKMVDLMYKADGVGLAAPQVGLNKMLTVVDAHDGTGVRIFFNIKIINQSYRQETSEEGCLSLPGVSGLVKRPRLITISYLDENGKSNILKCSPILSRILQHEIDHLNGILFIDKTRKITAGQEYLKQWQKGAKPLLPHVSYPYSYL